MNLHPFVLTLAVSLLSAAVGWAQPTVYFSFTPNGAPTTFSVPQGSTLAIPVYLIEQRLTAGVPNPPANGGDIVRTEGLFSGGVRLNFSTAAGSATVTTAVLNPSFNTSTSGFPVVNNPSGFASVTGGTTNLAGVPATVFNNQFVSVLVGTFTFQGNQTGNVTTISTAKPQAANFEEFLTNTTGTVLDNQTYANLFNATPSATTTITTVVPEPSGLWLIGGAAVGWLSQRRRA
jgi:hypothetical protein